VGVTYLGWTKTNLRRLTRLLLQLNLPGAISSTYLGPSAIQNPQFHEDRKSRSRRPSHVSEEVQFGNNVDQRQMLGQVYYAKRIGLSNTANELAWLRDDINLGLLMGGFPHRRLGLVISR
jgi:hypothetical protein